MGFYRQVRRVDHPKASTCGNVYEHVLIAERALGHCLPDGAEIHPVDGNKRNNANANLVICQGREYHLLLHVRANTLRAGGDPNTQRVCGKCQQPKYFDAFNRANREIYGRKTICRSCANEGLRVFRAARRAYNEATEARS